MVFKLIRTDTLDPKKIELPVGTHLIGRGNFLGCDDKRVSRQHGELEVTEDSVSIKSLHQNPCFYIRRSTKRSIVLKQNCTINLSHGDKFGLLPSTLWYELLDLEIKEKDSALFPRAGDKNCDNSLEQTVDSTITNSGSVTQTVNKSLQSSVNETVVDNEAANRAGTLLKQQSNQDNKLCTSSFENVEAKTIKRSHSITADNSSTYEIKKVKTELGDTKDVKPGPSNDQAALCGQGNGVPPSSVTPPVRERCFYGNTCFRRKAQHKAKFSHPRDPDWGTDERVVCPAGRACVRRDPRHWRDYTHPEGVLPPTHPQPPQSGVTESQQRNTESNEQQNDNQVDHADSEEDNCDDEEDNSENEEDNSDDKDTTDSEAYFDTDDQNDSDPEAIKEFYRIYNGR